MLSNGIEKLKNVASSLSLREAATLLLGAVLYALAMPGEKTSMGPVSYVALIPLFFCLKEKRNLWQAAMGGLLFGTASSFILLHWITFTVSVYGKLGFLIGTITALLLSVYCGMYISIFSLLTTAAVNGYGKYAFLGAPFLWGGIEIVRVKTQIGFPWLLFGYSQYGDYLARQFAAFGGVIGTSFLLVLINVLFFFSFDCLIAGIRKRLAVYLPIAMVLVVILHLPGYLTMSDSRPPGDDDTIVVSAVQPNIDLWKKWDERFQEETIRIIKSLTESQMRREVDLIVWPETALPFYFYWDQKPTEEVRDFVRRLGKPVLTGVPWYEAKGEGKFFNSIVLMSPSGKILQRYNKIKLVPFGEYIPFRTILFFLEKITEGAEDFSRGDGVKLLKWNDFKIVPTVCYEAIFPHLSVEGVLLGGNLLVNVTNDAWFGDTPAPYQQLHMAAYRSVETGRYMVRVSNSGISAVVDQYGRIENSIGLFERGGFTARARPFTGMTFYVKNAKFIDLFIIACSIILIVGTIIGRLKNGRHF